MNYIFGFFIITIVSYVNKEEYCVGVRKRLQLTVCVCVCVYTDTPPLPHYSCRISLNVKCVGR